MVLALLPVTTQAVLVVQVVAAYSVVQGAPVQQIRVERAVRE